MITKNVEMGININIEEIIRKTIREATNIIKLQDHKDKKIKKTPFQKTEELLYNYASFMESIELKKQQIETIKECGCINKSKSIVSFSGSCNLVLKDDNEKAEEQIHNLELRIKNIEKFIEIINGALEKIEDDPYYEIITLKYVNNKTHEEIAEALDKDATTVGRHKNRLVNKLKTYLFAEEVLYDIFINA
ncbi:sigma factor-like helix-turn-helix DNA-binding protein [Peptostreptococcaceae bacterium AGR-M142]